MQSVRTRKEDSGSLSGSTVNGGLGEVVVEPIPGSFGIPIFGVRDVPNDSFGRIVTRPEGIYQRTDVGAVLLGFLHGIDEPVVPHAGRGSGLARLDPADGFREQDCRPQCLGEVGVLRAGGHALFFDLVTGQIPMKALGHGGSDPMGGVDGDVRYGPGDLELQFGIGQDDNAQHQHHRADEGEDAVDGRALDVVLDLFGGEVELTSHIFITPHDEVATVGVADNDVAGWCTRARSSLGQFQVPLVADSHYSGQAGEQDRGEKGHAVSENDGNRAQDDGEEKP